MVVSGGRDPVIAEVEEPLGPGVDFERDAGGIALVGQRARDRGPWLGLDRGHLVDTDDGTGRATPALIAVPSSTFAGATIACEIVGGLAAHGRFLAVLRLPGARVPIDALVRVAAGGDFASGEWIDAPTTRRRVRDGRRAWRDRRARERIVGGRAWQPAEKDAPERVRFTTPHSLAEYSIARLPPRFVRGLEAILEADERILYWVERPPLVAAGLVERLHHHGDRRAALLLLTDHEVAWLVDHAEPDRYLSDWGVDVVSVPVERLADVVVDARPASVRVEIRTVAGATVARLPGEFAAEARVFGDLARRFLPQPGVLPRRIHDTSPIEPDWAALAPFGDTAELRELVDRAGPSVLAAVASPRRAGHRAPGAFVVTPGGVHVVTHSRTESVPASEIHAVELTLSTLAGRIAAIGMSLGSPAAPRDPRAARRDRRAAASSPRRERLTRNRGRRALGPNAVRCPRR